MDAFAKDLLHVVLVAPLGHPVKSFNALWRDFLPEATSIACSNKTNVVVVVPLHDSAQEVVQAFQRNLLGSSSVECKFGGPAYRTMPTDLKLRHLSTPASHELQEHAGLVNLVVEGFAGFAGSVAQHVRLGFVGRAFEKYPVDKDTPLPAGDITRPENFLWLERGIVSRQIFHLHLSPDCRKLSIMQNMNGTTRTAELPQGSSEEPDEKEANLLMAVTMWLILLCLIHGVSFGFEHPLRSRGFQFKFMLWLLSLVSFGLIWSVEYDSCAHGMRPGDWSPDRGDIRIQKTSKVITNNPFLEPLREMFRS